MHFVKLFSSIINSTIWNTDLATRVVWVTMLTMADADGYVRSSVPGLARSANVTPEECQRALALLIAPDPESATTEHEGRRIAPVEGGYQLLNYVKYRNMLTVEDRKARDRDRKRDERASKKIPKDFPCGVCGEFRGTATMAAACAAVCRESAVA